MGKGRRGCIGLGGGEGGWSLEALAEEGFDIFVHGD